MSWDFASTYRSSRLTLRRQDRHHGMARPPVREEGLARPPVWRPSPWRWFPSPRNHGLPPSKWSPIENLYFSQYKSPCSVYNRPTFDWIPFLNQKNFSEVPVFSGTGHLYSRLALSYSNGKVQFACVKHIKLWAPEAGFWGITHCRSLCWEDAQWRSETDLEVQHKPWRFLMHWVGILQSVPESHLLGHNGFRYLRDHSFVLGGVTLLIGGGNVDELQHPDFWKTLRTTFKI